MEIQHLALILQRIGFTEKEAKVYLSLLEFGETVTSAIARHSQLKRPTVYLTLENLQKK